MQPLVNELWEAADQRRANSKLTAAECAMPVLILLRHAGDRFKAFLREIEAYIPGKVPPKQREELIKLGSRARPSRCACCWQPVLRTSCSATCRKAGRCSALRWSRSVLRYIRKARPNGRSRVLSQ